MALEIKDGNFEELLASGKPLVVDFWATWCGPCKKIAPDVEALAEQYKDQVIIGKCDVDDNDEFIEEFSTLAKANPGNVTLNFHLRDEEGQQVSLTAKGVKISVQKDIIAYLKSQTALSYKIN